MSRRPEPPPIEDHNTPQPRPRRREEPEPPADTAVEQRPSGSLDGLLTGGQSGGADQETTAQRIAAGLVAMRRKPVDPMNDYVADSTRQLRWIRAAVAHQADLEDTSQQEVWRDAVLGVRPILPWLLDAYYLEFYGQPRPRPAAEGGE